MLGQEKVYVEGPQEVCPGSCHQYYFTDGNGNVLQCEEFSVEVLQEPFTDSYQFTPNWQTSNFELCYWSEGDYLFNIMSYCGDTIHNDTMRVFSFPLVYAEIVELDGSCSNTSQNGCFTSCVGNTVTYGIEDFDPNGIPLFVEYFGSSGGEIVAQDDFTITVKWTTPGTYYLDAFVFSEWDGCSENLSRCVVVLEEPEAAFSLDPEKNEYCLGEEIQMINESSGATSFEWDFGDGRSSEELQPLITYETPGNYTITLKALNVCGCFDIYEYEIEVLGLWQPTIDCRGTICENTEVTYTSQDDCSTYNWKVLGNGTITDGGSTTDNYITIDWGKGPEGNIELSLAGCNNQLCSTTEVFRIPIISDDAFITGDTKPCKGSTEFYSIHQYDATEYNWNVNGGSILAGQGTSTIMIKWDNTVGNGDINVDYYNCYLECGGSDDLSIQLLNDFDLEINNSIICAGDQLEASSKDINGSVSVDWILERMDGSVVTNSNGVNLNFSIPDSEIGNQLKLRAVSSAHCSDEKSVVIRVLEKSATVLAIEGEQVVCQGSEYIYGVTTGLSASSFRWIADDGGSVSEYQGESIVIKWNSSGPFLLQVFQTNTDGLYCESDPISLYPSLITAMNVAGTNSSCVESLETYNADFIEGMNYDWEVIPEDAGTIIEEDQNTISVLWHKSGSHKVSLSSCLSNEEVDVAVYDLPFPEVVAPDYLCTNEMVFVSINSSYSSQEWFDENNVLVSTNATPQLRAGSYTCKVVNSYGCVGQSSFTINEHPEPNIRISSPDSTGICLSEGDRFPDLYALDAEDGYTYEWYLDNVATGYTSAIYTAPSLGTYHVVVTDDNGCTNRSNNLRVFEYCGECNGTPQDGTCEPPCNTDDKILFGHTNSTKCNLVDFQNMSVGIDVSTIQWYFDDPNSGANNISYDENPSHEFSNAGFFNVVLFGDVDDKDEPGKICRDYRTEIVEVTYKADFEVINACPGEVLEFFDRSTYIPGKVITNWAWDFGDPSSTDNFSSLADPTHIYNAPGEYDVTLTITGDACTDVITKTIKVHEFKPNDIQDVTVTCQGESVYFELIDYDKISEVYWDFGDLASGDNNYSGGLNTYHKFESPGIYDVTAELTSIYGCKDLLQKQITIHENTLAGDISSSLGKDICEGEITQLSAPLSGMSYEWSNGETTEFVNITTSGVYYLTVTDGNGCTYQPDPYLVNVLSLPITSIVGVSTVDGIPEIYSGNRIEICENQDLILEAGSNSNYSYKWSNGSNGSMLIFSEELGNQLPAGVHNFELELTDDASGCVNVIGPIEVEVFGIPEVIIVADNSGVLCNGDSHTLTITNPVSSLNYVWNTGETSTSITVSEGGNYFVTAYNSIGCEGQSNSIEVSKGPDISMVPSGCHERCAPDTICMPSVPNVVTYQWFYEGIEVSDDDNGNMPELIVRQSGSYHLSMTDVNGCTNISDELFITLLDGFGDVEVVIYSDVDEDGTISSADTLVSGIDIALSDGSLGVSDGNGSFTFKKVVGGDYVVNIKELDDEYKSLIDSVKFSIVTCDDDQFIELLITKNTPEFIYIDEYVHLCHGEEIEIEGTNYDTEQEVIVEKDLGNGQTEVTTYYITASNELTFDVEFNHPCHDSPNGNIILIGNAGQDAKFYINGVEVSDQNFEDLGEGDYSIEVEDSLGCVTRLEEITLEDKGEIDYVLVNDPHSCDQLELYPSVEILNAEEEEYTVAWSNGDQGNQLQNYVAGAISVEITTSCQKIIETFYPNIENRIEEINLPNIFSPNNDGSNDFIDLSTDQYLNGSIVSFTVFDKMGRVVFQRGHKWTGKIDGIDLPMGIYFYVLDYESNQCGNKKLIRKQGDITLIR